MNYRYFEHFKEFWLPIYRKQVLNAKYNNEDDILLLIYENISKNWNLDLDCKKIIYEELGISYLDLDAYVPVKEVESADCIIIESYFKHKKAKLNESL